MRFRRERPVVTSRRLAVAAVFALLLYLLAIGWRGIVLLRTGSPVGVLFGVALLALPIVALWAVMRELRFGVAMEILAEDLEARGQLPEDDLPRSPGGRIDQAAADAWFETFRREVEERPQSWEAWFRLACGYDVAGDRRRGREAMRHAIKLHGPLEPTVRAAAARRAEQPSSPRPPAPPAPAPQTTPAPESDVASEEPEAARPGEPSSEHPVEP